MGVASINGSGGTAERGLPGVQMGIQSATTGGREGEGGIAAASAGVLSSGSGVKSLLPAGAPRQLRSADRVVHGGRLGGRGSGWGSSSSGCRWAAGRGKGPAHLFSRPAGKGGGEACCVLGLLRRPPAGGGDLRDRRWAGSQGRSRSCSGWRCSGCASAGGGSGNGASSSSRTGAASPPGDEMARRRSCEGGREHGCGWS
jgi:hypothetical protein